jgi:hypothetical protein
MSASLGRSSIPCAQDLLVDVVQLVRLLAAVSDMVWPQLSIRRPEFLIDVVQSLNFFAAACVSQLRPSTLLSAALLVSWVAIGHSSSSDLRLI